MSDPAWLTASLASPRSAPTSTLPVVDSQLERACRYRVKEVLWGNHRRFVVYDTATSTTIAIRTSGQIADSDLIRLNWAVKGCPDPGTAPRPALDDAPSEPIPDDASRRQCGRCRQFFASEPTQNLAPIQEWWLCEPCHDKLMGTSSAPTSGGPADSTAHPALRPPPVRLLR